MNNYPRTRRPDKPVRLYIYNTDRSHDITLDRAVGLLKANSALELSTRDCLRMLAQSASTRRLFIGGAEARKDIWLLED